MNFRVFQPATRGGGQYNFAPPQVGGIVRLVALLIGSLLVVTPSVADSLAAIAAYQDGEYGTGIDPARPLPAVELTNEMGETFTLNQLKGHLTLLYFGFTHCPHICPTTLAMLRGVRERLPAEMAKNLPVWLITVDPMRDTAELLREYVENFGPGFHGARADLWDLVPLLKALGVSYSYRADANGDNYDVGHTTTIFLLDDEARLARIYSSPYDASNLLESLRQQVAQ